MIENIVDRKVISVMFIESEVGYNQRGASNYFNKVVRRLKPYVDKYRKEGIKHFSLVIISNAPRRLSTYIKKHRLELEKEFGFQLIEGLTVFIVPVLLAKEIMPSIFVRAMSAPRLFTYT